MRNRYYKMTASNFRVDRAIISQMYYRHAIAGKILGCNANTPRIKIPRSEGFCNFIKRQGSVRSASLRKLPLPNWSARNA